MNKNYIDVTDEWLRDATPNSHKIEEQLYYEHGGVKYEVDGKKVVLDYSKKEIEVAEWLENTFGGEIKMIPRVNYPEGIKTPDYIFRGEYWDLKSPNGNGKRLLEDLIKNNREQARNFIVDISNSKITIMKLNTQIFKLFNSKNTNWVNILIVIKLNKLICIVRRKRD